MARGGARNNAGRPPGHRNKATIEREIEVEHGVQMALNEGVMPRDVMLAVMRKQPLANGMVPDERQFAAAVAVAPYLHPKLNAVAVKDVTTSNLPLEEQVARFREHLANPKLRHITGRLIDVDEDDT